MQGPQGPAGASGTATLAGASRTVPFCRTVLETVNILGGSTTVLPFSFDHLTQSLAPDFAANAFIVQKPDTIVRRLAWSIESVVYGGDTSGFVASIRVYAADPGSSSFAALPDFAAQSIPPGSTTSVQTNVAPVPTALQPGARLTLVAELDNTGGNVNASISFAALAASIAIEEGATTT